MTRGLLLVGPKEKKVAAKIVKHSKKRSSWYDPSAPLSLILIPGNNPKHVCKMGNHRCVFSYTVDRPNNRVVRHLSISVPNESYPLPAGVKMIAPLFGFTGSDGKPDTNYPDDWVVHVKADEQIDDHCIVVGQDTGIKP